MAMFDLTCVGLATVDILGRHMDTLPSGDRATHIEEIQITAAGTAAAPAVIAARHGLRTQLVAGAGADFLGDILRMALEREGVDIEAMQLYPGVPTSATILPITSRGDRPLWHAAGAARMLRLEAPFDSVLDTRYLHYGGAGLHPLFDGGMAASVLSTARERGITTTCDTISARPAMLTAISPILAAIDYFMPTVDEAQELSSTTSPDEAARYFLDAGVGTCIFKDGPRGSLIFTNSGVTRIPAFGVDVVDTTGCGDAYCGGFVSGLARGMELHDACRFASASAALVAGALGSQGLVVDFETTLAEMNSLEPLGLSR